MILVIRAVELQASDPGLEPPAGDGYDASMDKVEALGKTELFGSLAEGERKALAGCCVEKRLKVGETLFVSGEEAKGLYVIVRGCLKAIRENTEGREQVIHVEKTGSTIAEIPVFDGRPYPSTVVAEEDSEILFIDKRDVRRLCLEHPGIALTALRILSARLRKTAALVESLSLREVDQRLASYLIQEFKGRGYIEKKKIKLRLPSNTVIAARVGSVREVVSRAFSKLESKGLIALNKSRVATLLREKELRAYADPSF